MSKFDSGSKGLKVEYTVFIISLWGLRCSPVLNYMVSYIVYAHLL